MDTNVDASGGGVAYDLSCVDCTYSETVEGDIDEVFEAIEGHQGMHPADALEHFVEFEQTGLRADGGTD